MNRERLLELANEVLPNVPAAKFDLGHWKCGTSACAVGWAAQHPAFIAQGLSLTPAMIHGVRKPRLPRFLGFEGWGAVEKFFNLTEREASFLFVEASYDGMWGTTAEQVSQRIRAFVACNLTDAEQEFLLHPVEDDE